MGLTPGCQGVPGPRMVKKPIRTNIQINATALTAAAQPSADSRSARSTQAKHPALLDPDTNPAAPSPQMQSRPTHHRPLSTALPSSPTRTARRRVN